MQFTIALRQPHARQRGKSKTAISWIIVTRERSGFIKDLAIEQGAVPRPHYFPQARREMQRAECAQGIAQHGVDGGYTLVAERPQVRIVGDVEFHAATRMYR